MNKVKIETLLVYRDLQYKKVTEEIISSIQDFVIKAVKLYLGKDLNITISEFLASDIPDHVLLELKYNSLPGDIIEVNGQTILINDENKNDYTGTLRLVLPFRILNTGDFKQVYRFISEVRKLTNSGMTSQQFRDILQNIKLENLDHYLDIEDSSPIVERITAPSEEDGFDIRDLSKQQIGMLKYFSNSGVKH